MYMKVEMEAHMDMRGHSHYSYLYAWGLYLIYLTSSK